MGMLFDHGIDAIIAIISTILITRFFQVGTGTIYLICFIIPTVPWYYANFGEYYTGVLHLPAMSGPEDAELIYVILCFVSAYLGDDYWNSS